MHVGTLERLRCPFCGTQPTLIDNSALVRTSIEIESGVLGCECCAFPIVAGIAVMIADDRVRAAMHQLEAGDRDAALFTMLGLHEDAGRAEAFRALLHGNDTNAVGAGLQTRPNLTYQNAIAILSPDAEGQYFVYRFSDPTFLMASAVLHAVAQHPAVRARPALDLCGGSGHLTRVIGQLTSPGETTLADVYFWKLWLARRFTAPECTAVCCDANHPLPFARDTFSLVVCSDAFPYIWHKRLMAEEMMRLAGEDGIVALPHLHSVMGDNFSAGMTLTPAAYRNLFAPLGPRLFKDSVLLEQALDGGALHLESDAPLSALDSEPSLTLIATRHAELFRTYDPPAEQTSVAGTLAVNPLYRIERRGSESILTLAFPTPEYEEEFGEAKRYLPATVTVAADLTAPFDATSLGDACAGLRRRHVIIDAPVDYC